MNEDTVRDIEAKRKPYSTIHDETELLGAIFLDEESSRDAGVLLKALDILEKEDFLDKEYAKIFEACFTIAGRDQPITMATMTHETGFPPESFADLMNGVAIPRMGIKAAQRIKQGSLNRQLDKLLEERAKGEQVQERLDELLKSMMDLQARIDTLSDIPTDVLSVKARWESEQKTATFIPTGWTELDKTCKGFIAGHFWVIGAYTSVGKTTFALQTISNICRRGAKVALYSLEMKDTEIYNRLKEITTSVDEFKLNIINNKTSIEQISLALSRKKKPDVVFIDYLQLMDFGVKEDEYKAMTRISTELQRIALREGVTIVSLSQFSNEGAALKDLNVIKLKGSGQIAASADKIVVLQRTELDSYDSSLGFSPKIPTKMILRKNRQGKRGAQVLQFNSATGFFEQDDDGDLQSHADLFRKESDKRDDGFSFSQGKPLL